LIDAGQLKGTLVCNWRGGGWQGIQTFRSHKYNTSVKELQNQMNAEFRSPTWLFR
jgi:hypothetical protein